MNYTEQILSGVSPEVVLDAAFDELNTLIKDAKSENKKSKLAFDQYKAESNKYREQWLNSERAVYALTHKLACANRLIGDMQTALEKIAANKGNGDYDGCIARAAIAKATGVQS